MVRRLSYFPLNIHTCRAERSFKYFKSAENCVKDEKMTLRGGFAIILMEKRELVALLCLSFWCLMIVVSLPHDATGLSAVCDCGIS